VNHKLGTEDLLNPFRGMDLAHQITMDIRNRNPRSRNYVPVYIQIGVGFKRGVYEGRTVQREFDRVLGVFNTLGYPARNVIGVDINKDALDSWKGTGATRIHGDWNDKDILLRVKEKAMSFRFLPPLGSDSKLHAMFYMVYIDTWGGRDCLEVMDNVRATFNPQCLYNFFAFRRAFNSASVHDTIEQKFPTYKFKQTGGDAISSREGILTYPGGAMACLSRI